LDQRIFVLDSQKHIFSNPHGLLFEIGCFSSAPGCLALGQKTSKFTWFPGYAWQIAVCGGCREHMGWLYAGQGTSFFGLRLDQLVLAAPGPK
jgi:hypothetical protein